MAQDVRGSLNTGNPNSAPAALNLVGVGEALNQVNKTVRGTVTSHVLTLPESQRAIKILQAYGMGGSSGYKTPAADGSNAAPGAGTVRINAAGNIQFAAADAITAAVVEYVSPEGEVFEETIDVAANLGTLLASRRAIVLLSVTRVTGGAIGACTLVHRPQVPVAGESAINGASDASVEFAAADAVTRATVRYLAIPGVGSTARTTVATALQAAVAMV